jgi:hypothetical protein
MSLVYDRAQVRYLIRSMVRDPYPRETLVLTKDQRFTQIFETFQPARREEVTGTWYLEQRASGCVYLHLQGMRFYYGSATFERYGNRWSPQGDPYPFWERCEAAELQW